MYDVDFNPPTTDSSICLSTTEPPCSPFTDSEDSNQTRRIPILIKDFPRCEAHFVGFVMQGTHIFLYALQFVSSIKTLSKKQSLINIKSQENKESHFFVRKPDFCTCENKVADQLHGYLTC